MQQVRVRLDGGEVVLRSPDGAVEPVAGGVLVTGDRVEVAARAPVMLPAPGAPVPEDVPGAVGGDRR